MNGPIQNAFSIPLNQNPGTLPQVNDALQSWFQLMVFSLVQKKEINSVLVETQTPISFQGVWQPLSPQEVNMKPVGQREWKWFQVHAEISLLLNPDDVINYQDTQYRVKSKMDYSSYGYVRYDLIQDFTGSGPNT